jgi:FAD/FMN-containing dehydrogenase/Fe-S oxidoreductase
MITFLEHTRHSLATHLRRNLAGEVRFDLGSRKVYSTDASLYQIEPLGVVIPKTVDDIAITVQIVAEMGLSITSRGGGTSLSGQAIGPGVVLDCSKYLNQILDLDTTNKVARIQPGLVLDTFNRELANYDLQFGPDVSTSSRAVLGGLIGNNSAGSRSIVYGKTIDHVRSVDVVLRDASRQRFAPMSLGQWQQSAKGTGIVSEIIRDVRRLIAENRDEIVARYPTILRRVSGYNLDALLELTEIDQGQTPGLHSLIVGSEGTLGVIAEAEVALVAKPKHRGLLIPQFDTLASSMDALSACLEMSPSAVELMDQLLLELTKGNLALKDTTKNLDPRTKAIFMVEFSSDDAGEVADRVERLQSRLKGVKGLICTTPAIDPALRDPLWNLRRAAMPLLYGMKGDGKPITFVEDCAVSPEVLPSFVKRFKEILHRNGTDGSFYGHASVGCLHIRPVLNLKDPQEVARMRQITDEVTDLVLEYRGSLSGEHGDGLVRSEWNKKMFGEKLYDAFCRLKRSFDPNNLFNPGKIVHAVPMTENLRYKETDRPYEPPTVFDYSKQQGFLRSIEMCNGNGACRKTTGGAMCPSYRATLDEKDSTRGRANALRQALNGDPALAMRTLRERWVHEVFDLCLMCKACKSECPSNVDVGKLKAEFLQFYHQVKPRPLSHWLVAGIPYFNRLGAPLAPLVNWMQSRGLSRWLLDHLAGIDARRSLPSLHADHFRSWFRRHPIDPRAGRAGKVILLADCFTTYNEPSVGKSAVRVLESAGYRVELSDLFCCNRVLISKGFLKLAQSRIKASLGSLSRKIADGTPILGLEPSCLLTLNDEWPELVPTAEAKRVAQSAFLADGWLAAQIEEGKCDLSLPTSDRRCLLHGHCHQKALHGVGASAPLLRRVPGMEVKVLDAGCCGMAGSFGFEKEHYDLSVKIANLALIPALNSDSAATVVAPGTSCRHQILDLTGRKALHPLELIAEQLPPG